MTTLRSEPPAARPQASPADAGARRAPEASEDHGHDPSLAHHFRSRGQQFSAAKFGMWLFLATEVLLFGGLFCFYAVYRASHPEVYAYGAAFLDVRLGATNTVVLILSSLTMALAVTFAQRGRPRLLVGALLLTLLGGVTFLGIKYVEYTHKFDEHLVWGEGFYDEEPPHDELLEAATGEDEPALAAEAPDAAPVYSAEIGRELWMSTCRSCHGVAGEGIAGQGKDIRGTEFITSRDDRELVNFLKVGRMPFDPANTTGLQMPPKGGNPRLTEEDLHHIVAYIRTFESSAAATTEEPGAPEGAVEAEAELAAGEGEAVPTAAGEEAAVLLSAPEDDFFIPKSILPPAPQGPPGLATEFLASLPTPIAVATVASEGGERPAGGHFFFNAYYLLTGLHGVHVVVGMIVIAWLTVGAIRGRYGPRYFTPVDLGGLYWHLVDLIWIFLFPLLYLV